MTENEMERASVGLLKKLHAIMSECAYLQRDKKNEFHKYSYASEAAIKALLHEQLVKHGVLFHMSALEVSERPAANGKDFVTTQAFLYWFQDVDTGECCEKKKVYGSGADQLDKAVFKSHTGALKYALSSQFLIATGDDPESEGVDKHRKLKESASKVDTGGQPVGTPAAQRAVAERKIAETRPKPASQDERFKMLEAFQGVKADLKRITGEDKEYYAILGANGYEKSSQIENLEKARPIYEQLRARFKMIMDSIEAKGTAR